MKKLLIQEREIVIKEAEKASLNGSFTGSAKGSISKSLSIFNGKGGFKPGMMSARAGRSQSGISAAGSMVISLLIMIVAFDFWGLNLISYVRKRKERT